MANLERIDVGRVGSVWVDRRQPKKPRGVFEHAVPQLENEPLTKTRVNLGEPAGPEEQKRIDAMKLPQGTYPGGGQIEGWSPLRDRSAWKVPEAANDLKPLLPEWYMSIRSEVAVWLEIMRRIQPYIKVGGVRLSFPVYALPAIMVLVGTALFIPGPAFYNVFLIPILLMGGDIKALDNAIALSQPFLWPIVNTVNALVWAGKSLLSLIGRGRLAKLNYYPLFNRSKKKTEQKG